MSVNVLIVRLSLAVLPALTDVHPQVGAGPTGLKPYSFCQVVLMTDIDSKASV